MPEAPLWERRFRAPTRTLPVWAPAAPERSVVRSDEEGSFQAYAWELGADRPRRRTDEPVGVITATISADGSSVVWFSDPTGDESGRWLAVHFEGGESREVFPGAPNGWPEGLALGRELAVGVIADRNGFAVHVSERGGPATEILRHPDVIGFSDSDLHLEGFDHVGLSADETLVCVETAQDGDNIHRRLLVLDPRSGAEAGVLADGPGLAVSAFGWSPVPGDQRMLFTNERDDATRPGVWNPTTGERSYLEIDLPGDVIPVDWWPDARSILLVHLFRGRDRLYRYGLGRGTLTEIAHPAGEIHGARVRPGGVTSHPCTWSPAGFRKSHSRYGRPSRTPPGAGARMSAPASSSSIGACPPLDTRSQTRPPGRTRAPWISPAGCAISVSVPRPSPYR